MNLPVAMQPRRTRLGHPDTCRENTRVIIESARLCMGLMIRLAIYFQNIKTLKMMISTATKNAAEIATPMGVLKNDCTPMATECSV